MNLELLNVIYPKDIRHLIDELDQIEPFAFAISLSTLLSNNFSRAWTQLDCNLKCSCKIELKMINDNHCKFLCEVHQPEQKVKSGKLFVRIEKEDLIHFPLKFQHAFGGGGYSKVCPIIDVRAMFINNDLADSTLGISRPTEPQQFIPFDDYLRSEELKEEEEDHEKRLEKIVQGFQDHLDIWEKF